MQERRPDSPLDGDQKHTTQLDEAAEAVGSSIWPVVLGVSVVAIVVLVADQLTKTWAERALANEIIHVVGPLQLALTYNRGMAFGVGTGIAPYLVAFTIAAVLFVMVKKSEHLSKFGVLGVGLVLGGAIGNVCDRLFRSHNGAVVDFIDLQWWPVFNLADSAVVLGALTLVIIASRHDSQEASTND